MGKGKPLFYFEESNRAAAMLDEYDFENFLIYYFDRGIVDVCEIEEALSKEIGGCVKEAFEMLSIDEVVDYLSDRYAVHFVENVWYEMRIGTGNVGGNRNA